MSGTKISVRGTGITFVALLLLFQDPLRIYTSGVWSIFFSYIDEVIALISLLYLCVVIGMMKFKRKLLFSACVPLVVVVFVGFVVGIWNGYQKLHLLILDGFLCLKFVLCVTACELYFYRNPLNNRMMHKYLVKPFRWIVIILSVLFFHDLLFKPFFSQNEYRYFMHSMKLMFSEPTALVATCVAMIGILVWDLQNDKKNYIYIVLLSLIVCGTLKSKALAFILLTWMILLLNSLLKGKRKILFYLLAATGAFLIGYSQIEYYFLEGMNSSSRGIMLRDAIRLANHNLFGTGLASFGSYAAQLNYSYLYETLGYNRIWGLSKNYGSFLCDNFFALILGQFGWIGLIAIIMMFWGLFRKFETKCRIKYQYNSLILMWGYLIIAAFGETSIFNTYAVLLALAIGSVYSRPLQK